VTLDEVLTSLFPGGHAVAVDNQGLIFGSGPLEGGRRAQVIGIANRTPLGVDGAIKLASKVLELITVAASDPLLVLVDSDSQRMSKRDELLGLSEYLAHLSKCLILADIRGIHTIGVLYGHTAAGAFIATALSTRTLVALPGAAPQVMDLPSMSRVTKLPLEVLREKARSTPVFAPGLDNLAQTGAILEIWDPKQPLSAQLAELLQRNPVDGDRRDVLGKERKGRPKAADIALRVKNLVAGHG
jgi:malonate decarboxylase gamma subunit